MTSTLPVRGNTRPRLQLRLDPALAERLESIAEKSGVSQVDLARLILGRALEDDANNASEVLRGLGGDELVGLACLWATEEALRTLAVMHPHLSDRLRGVKSEALEAAETRLSELRQHLTKA